MSYEIADATGLGSDLKGQLVVFLEGGSNPMTDEAWETYVPPPGYLLNTPRAAWFSELHVLGSPYVPTGEITMITTPDGYTWKSVAAVQRSVYPYIPLTVNGQTLSPQEMAYSMTTPPAGMVQVDSNDKNHENVYYGIEGPNANSARLQYFIDDLWGNTYILKSLNAANSTAELVAQAVADAILPLGWTKPEARYFTQDVVYSPSYSGPSDSIAHANEFRDSADSAWMQIEWGATGMTLNAAAEGGLPIWAGPDGGRLLGSYNDDMLYGAQGHDLLFAGQGDDLLDGGQGLNQAFFSGALSEYLITRIDGDSVEVADTVSGRDGTDTLVRVQWAHFTDCSLWLDSDTLDVEGNLTPGARLNLYFETSDNAVVIGSQFNDFIKFASTNSIGKAVDGSAGDDVIDGGVGSTFITGGPGDDTIFLDWRASGVSWSTLTDFQFGQDGVLIWGWRQGVSKVSLLDEQGGADGYKGLTLHFENLLPDEAGPDQTNSNFNSITFTGRTLAEFGATSLEDLNAQINAGTDDYFFTDQMIDEYGVHGYLMLAQPLG